jgi:low affinity Fe/Cu permease
MKLDEIIRATLGAHNVLLDLENRSDDEPSVLRDHYAGLASRARADVRNGLQDTGAGSDQVT